MLTQEVQYWDNGLRLSDFWPAMQRRRRHGREWPRRCAAKMANWQMISYGNVLHGSTNPGADGTILPSARYDAWASARA
jgi:hypothetical protein